MGQLDIVRLSIQSLTVALRRNHYLAVVKTVLQFRLIHRSKWDFSRVHSQEITSLWAHRFQRNGSSPKICRKAMDVMDQWKPLCEKYNCTIANLALAWILAQGDFINLLSGSTTVDQIAENVKSAELELDSADVAMMRDMVEAIDK